MKSSFGQSVNICITGESHGEALVAVLSGLTPGIKIDREYIRHCLSQRAPVGNISTPRHEADEFEILSGVFEGMSTGTPITILIRNTNTKSKDYSEMAVTPRPGHADFTAEAKYHGFQDYRGGGHFSGRITASLVAAGAIARLALKNKGIEIGTHISKCGGVADREFQNVSEDIKSLENKYFAVLDDESSQKMQERILEASQQGDSVGGILETAVCGLPAGLGEPWFDSMESVLSHMLFSIPGVKGVEFGAGFSVADMRGSEVNGSLCVNNGKITPVNDLSGGVNGGITNGDALKFRLAVRPTPTIFKEQNTVDMKKLENKTLSAKGRHDPAIVHRVRAVVDAATALVLCDMMAQRFGTDWAL
ncbi:MAG: chorismate synthase [Ruminococcaceae bacterium]|nr:chorismate synthase [Oscillospiraceae bacterium]